MKNGRLPPATKLTVAETCCVFLNVSCDGLAVHVDMVSVQPDTSILHGMGTTFSWSSLFLLLNSCSTVPVARLVHFYTHIFATSSEPFVWSLASCFLCLLLTHYYFNIYFGDFIVW